MKLTTVYEVQNGFLIGLGVIALLLDFLNQLGGKSFPFILRQVQELNTFP